MHPPTCKSIAYVKWRKSSDSLIKFRHIVSLPSVSVASMQFDRWYKKKGKERSRLRENRTIRYLRSIWEVFDVAWLICHGSLNIGISFRDNRFIFFPIKPRSVHVSRTVFRERIVDAKFSMLTWQCTNFVRTWPTRERIWIYFRFISVDL